MLEFFGTGRVKEDKVDIALDAIRRYVPTTAAEEGTLTYKVYQHVDDPCRCMFYEVYRDMDAKKAHNSSPHLKEMMDVLLSAMEGEAVTGFYNIIAEK